ncbi:hypothetical protein AAHA92_00476 [Salvia divinorum]|uniref:Uncharacterized protein n=1 Tax=Salvia divinorum TaxID=28513 RepID=A0ABD1IJQ4_SALDI
MLSSFSFYHVAKRAFVVHSLSWLLLKLNSFVCHQFIITQICRVYVRMLHGIALISLINYSNVSNTDKRISFSGVVEHPLLCGSEGKLSPALNSQSFCTDSEVLLSAYLNERIRQLKTIKLFGNIRRRRI